MIFLIKLFANTWNIKNGPRLGKQFAKNKETMFAIVDPCFSETFLKHEILCFHKLHAR